MYALIISGGQQHKVEPGRYVTVNRLAVDEGAPVNFDRVLLVRTEDGTTVGTPAVPEASVQGRVKRHVRGKKVHGFKYKAKKGYRRSWGARADLTQVVIEAIVVGEQTYAAEAVEDEPVEAVKAEVASVAAEAEEAADADEE